MTASVRRMPHSEHMGARPLPRLAGFACVLAGFWVTALSEREGRVCVRVRCCDHWFALCQHGGTLRCSGSQTSSNEAKKHFLQGGVSQSPLTNNLSHASPPQQ